MMNIAWLLLAVVLATAVQSEGWELYDKCDVDFEKIGCYNDKSENRALPKELLNERDITNPSYDGHTLDWKNFKEYISKLACRCAAKSRDLGYEVFGLQFYGECWSGLGEYDKHGKAEPDKCVREASLDVSARTCVEGNEEVCVGSQNTNFVYRLTKKSVDGGYSAWSDWAACSKTCGGGVTQRTHKCNNPKPQGHGKDCSGLGPAQESKECAKEKCIPDVDGGYSKWSDWTACSKTCGGGVTQHTHKCDNPKPQGHGKDCSGLGPAKESKECAKNECKPVCDRKLDVGIVIDGSFSVRKKNFEKVRKAVKDLVDYLKVSPQGTHVGITLYSTAIEIKHWLNGVQTPSKLKEVINDLKYPHGRTYTDKALKRTATQMFSSDKGARSGVPNLVIVLTDGGNTKGKAPLRRVIEEYYKNKINTIAVGIGRNIKMDQLLIIAQGNQDNVILAKDFDVLKEKLEDIVKQACEE